MHNDVLFATTDVVVRIIREAGYLEIANQVAHDLDAVSRLQSECDEAQAEVKRLRALLAYSGIVC